MKQRFYEKTWFKNTILISIPSFISVIGVLVSLMGDGIVKVIFCSASIVLMVFLVFSVIHFSNQEEKIYNEYEKIKDQNAKLTAILAHLENDYKTSTYTVSVLTQTIEKWAKNINSFANNVADNGWVSDKAWDSIRFFDLVCQHCRDMIKKYCNNDDDSKISVSFVQYREDLNNEKWVHMVAHSNPESTRPNACKEAQKLSDCLYHYANLIKEGYSDIEVAVDNIEIQRIFKKISVNTDLNKYSQYIAVPVYCSKRKLLGIFQVVTKHNYIIENDRVELIQFATRNILPYSNLILLIDKIGKGLYVSPKQINRES